MEKGFSGLIILLMMCLVGCQNKTEVRAHVTKIDTAERVEESVLVPENKGGLDTAEYNQFWGFIDTTGQRPKHDFPKEGAILPFKRIISYYGNLYSKKMGVLGEYPKAVMIEKLKAEVEKWNRADSLIPSIPALHYIAVTAQKEPGKGNTYRQRMPFQQIDTVIKWAKEIDALVFVDIQVGHSTLESEIPRFEEYLAMPEVHLAIDAEFSMKNGKVPGSTIGTFDATDINFTSKYLAELVKKYNIPPKILVLHRFTNGMLTNYKNIELFPEVQVVVHMDGWGNKAKKRFTYKHMVTNQPVQFPGFKVFYKNDVEMVGEKLEMQPAEILKLNPKPVFISYQ